MAQKLEKNRLSDDIWDTDDGAHRQPKRLKSLPWHTAINYRLTPNHRAICSWRFISTLTSQAATKGKIHTAGLQHLCTSTEHQLTDGRRQKADWCRLPAAK